MPSGRPLRILVVSALYPPNFIGGATVQAQRLVRAMQARGHTIRVLAGHMDPSRPTGSTWEEIDDAGVPVTWLATTDWLEFSSERNHANPVAERILADMLRTEPADVVHLHALQGLGGGLAPVAASAGAKVVVTMHDWWWFCARQFLADRHHIPCCPVVEAGVCPCEVDRAWTDERRRMLARDMHSADLVLAPSRPAATSLRANGVPADRLHVDENGLPAQDLSGLLGAPAVTPREGPLRFLYVGGSYEMKGVRQLVDAARTLKTTPGWTLIAYGVREWLRDHMVEVHDLPVEVRESFPPGEAGDVYSGADVLVVPSVVTESYSLVTREALLRGLPVVCTDSLGPEEVVVDGRNGLVVPAADPSSLADAMRRLVQEPGLLDRLRSGIDGVSVRTLEEQADELEVRYRTIASSPAPAKQGHGTEGVLFVTGIEGAPLRYRAWIPAEALSLSGVGAEIRSHTDPEAFELARRVDAIVAYRVPATPAILEMIGAARARGVPVLFDVDDLIFEPELAADVPAVRALPAEEAELWLEGVRRYRTTMQSCDMFIGSTQALCDHADRIGMPAALFPNGVGLRASRLSDAALYRPRTPGPPRVAYLSGTTTHDEDWLYAEPGVMEALDAVPASELWLIGHVPDTDATRALGPRLRRVPFTHWERLPSILRDVDVNLAPLVPGSEFNEAKSAIKWLEAALVATPTVASPTQPFREAIEDGSTGVLAAGPEEFASKLERLLGDATARSKIGRAARRRALFELSPRVQSDRYVQILLRARESRASGSDVGPLRIEPVSRTEEPRPAALEPYHLSLAHAGPAPAAPGRALEPGRPLRWSPSAPVHGLARVDLLTATFGGPGCDLRLRLVDATTGSEIASADLPAHRLADGGWTAATLGPLPAPAPPVMFELEAGPGPRTAVWLDASGIPVVRLWREPEYGIEPPDLVHPTSRPVSAKIRLAVYLVRSEGAAGLLRHARRAIARRLFRRSA